VTAESVPEDADVVYGMFLINSIIASALFDSGASHSFLTKSFVEKHNIPNYRSVFRDRGVPKPTSECRRVPQPRWVDARPSAKGGSEVAGDGRE
jgi:hypothetical protein